VMGKEATVSEAKIIDLMEVLKRSLAERREKGWPERVPDARLDPVTAGEGVTEFRAEFPEPKGEKWAPKRYRGTGPKPAVRKGQAKLW